MANDSDFWMVSSGAFTESQWNIITIPMQLGALLSFLASMTIIVMIKCYPPTRQRPLSQIHNRILFGMSSLDIINTLGLMLATVPVPKDLKSIIYGASGNDTTCFIQGLVMNFCFSAIAFYNAVLSLYYLATIKYSLPILTLQKYERYAHIMAILVPTALAVFAGANDLFQPMLHFPMCFFSDSSGCEIDKALHPEDRADYDCDNEPMDNNLQNFINIQNFFNLLVFVTIIYSMVEITRVVQDSVTSGGDAIWQDRDQVRDTYIQAWLYIGAFTLTNFGNFADAISHGRIRNSVLSIMFANLTFSLQGFFTWAAFMRPRYLIVEKKMREASFLELLMHATFRPYNFVSFEDNNEDNIQNSSAYSSVPSYEDHSDGTPFTTCLSYPSKFSVPRSAGDDVFHDTSTRQSISVQDTRRELSGFGSRRSSFSFDGNLSGPVSVEEENTDDNNTRNVMQNEHHTDNPTDMIRFESDTNHLSMEQMPLQSLQEPVEFRYYDSTGQRQLTPFLARQLREEPPDEMANTTEEEPPDEAESTLEEDQCKAARANLTTLVAQDIVMESIDTEKKRARSTDDNGPPSEVYFTESQGQDDSFL